MDVSESTVIVWRLGALIGHRGIQQLGYGNDRAALWIEGREVPNADQAQRLEAIYRTVRRVIGRFEDPSARRSDPTIGQAFITARCQAANGRPLYSAIVGTDTADLPDLLHAAAIEFITHRGAEHWRLGA